MSFNPDLPAPHSPVSSAELRGQFNGLKELHDALAAIVFNEVVIDSVTTLDAGQPATVSATFTGTTLHLSFGIPRGSDGTPGSNGADGAPGQPGPMGEVTGVQLNTAIEGTARNPTNVAELNLGSSDPEIQQLEAKLNELITALKRV